MKCDDVNRIAVLAIVFALIGDILALGAELLSQRCAKNEEVGKTRETADLNKKLADFERRISRLEKVSIQ